jgi:hypothetical protein
MSNSLFHRSLEDDMCSKAFRTIHLVLKENRIKYSNNDWRLQSSDEHMKHALLHCAEYFESHKREELTSALTRIAMADFILNQELYSLTIEDDLNIKKDDLKNDS